MNHYVYKFTNNTNNMMYIGKRSCNCPIEEDDYKTSSKIVEPLLKSKPWLFKKEILGVYETEIDAYDAEARFLTLKHIKTGMFYNKIPGGHMPPSFKGRKHTKKSMDKLRKKVGTAIIINGVPYDSLRQGGREEGVSYETLRLAIKNNKKSCKNRQGKEFRLEYSLT